MCFNTIVQRDNELVLFNPHVAFGKLFYDHRNPGYKTRKQIECKKLISTIHLLSSSKYFDYIKSKS